MEISLPSLASSFDNSSLLCKVVPSFIRPAVKLAKPALSTESSKTPPSRLNNKLTVGVSLFLVAITSMPLSNVSRHKLGTVICGLAPELGITLRSKSLVFFISGVSSCASVGGLLTSGRAKLFAFATSASCPCGTIDKTAAPLP